MTTRSATTIVAGVVLVVATASAAGRTRSWESHWTTGDVSQVRALDVDDEFAFVAASGAEFDVRAVALRTGDLLWRHEGESPTVGSAQAVRYADGAVWAAGSGAGVGGGADWLVRSIDPDDGATLWQDLYDFRELGDSASAIDVASGRVFVAGTVQSFLRFGAEYLVRAYDAGSGALLWQDLAATGGNDAALHVVADDDGVWVAGILAPVTIPDIVVRAYDPATGEVRWSRRIDIDDDYPSGIARLGPRVAVSGESGGRWMVTAYDAATGRRLWRHLDAGALQPGGVIGARGAFVVTGAARGAATFDLLTRSYDARTGAILWEDRLSRAGREIYGRALDHRGDLVVSAATVFGDPLGHAVWVRALDPASGALRWEYGFQMPGSDVESSVVELLRGRLIVGGLLRPFDATSGAMLLGYRVP